MIFYLCADYSVYSIKPTNLKVYFLIQNSEINLCWFYRIPKLALRLIPYNNCPITPSASCCQCDTSVFAVLIELFNFLHFIRKKKQKNNNKQQQKAYQLNIKTNRIKWIGIYFCKFFNCSHFMMHFSVTRRKIAKLLNLLNKINI